MSECNEITTRRTWCGRKAAPGSDRCAIHQSGPYFEARPDHYSVADAKLRESELAEGMKIS